MIHFSNEDIYRSIPSICDGLKPSQRKVLFGALSKKINSKADEIRIGMELNVPFEDTWSCYDPQFVSQPCQVCTACVKRQEAFESAGVRDPVIHDGLVIKEQ